MSKYKSPFLQVCHERGFIHQLTNADALDEYLKNGNGVAYIGFDCTAPSLHAGSLVQIMLLHWFQKTGNKPIVLMGGGTTKVGDPSGKDESRQLLSEEKIAENLKGIKKVFSNYIEFEGNSSNPQSLIPNPQKAIMVNNADWLEKLNYIEFLRDYGRHFSVNKMMSMDSVKLRLERDQHLSFLEFNYMILQAYDFVELNKRYGCRLQMGGSDQWGNIINGVELNRKVFSEVSAQYEHNADWPPEKDGEYYRIKEEIFGLTTPLLTTASGAKMGKTTAGAVWLDAAMLSPYEYWQYFRNTEDADVGKFLRLFTTIEMDEIRRLEKLEGAEINEAKKILATEVTALCHGREAAEQAAETARKTFEEGAAGDNLPTVVISEEEAKTGVKLIEIYVKAGLATSNGEVRRLMQGGGVKVNDATINDDKKIITLADFKDNAVKISAGKKKHALIKLS